MTQERRKTVGRRLDTAGALQRSCAILARRRAGARRHLSDRRRARGRGQHGEGGAPATPRCDVQ